MNHIIQEALAKITEELEENVRRLLEDGDFDISEFAERTQESLNQAGTVFVQYGAETLDGALRESPERKKYWNVKNRNDERTVVTPLGESRIRRTCFEKEDGSCCYLADEMMGLGPHERMDLSMQAKIVEEAIDSSYQKGGEQACGSVEFTRETTKGILEELGPVPNEAVPYPEGKRDVRVLYIEADEDHVALQGKGAAQPRLTYVHEGRKQEGQDRWSLKNARYFSGTPGQVEELWLEVADYITAVYELDKVEKIYLSGDGAGWIRSGLEWIRGSTFVLDRYHLSKYVMGATGHMPYIRSFMWEYIQGGDQEELRKLFSIILEQTGEESRKKTVLEARRYIQTHWEAIQRQEEAEYCGCSAEGHVSHVYAARMSSRPMGWSREGVKRMASLRVFRKNEGKVYDFMKAKKREERRQKEREQADRRIRDLQKHLTEQDTIGNITTLNIGKRTGTYKLLRAIRAC